MSFPDLLPELDFDDRTAFWLYITVRIHRVPGLESLSDR